MVFTRFSYITKLMYTYVYEGKNFANTREPELYDLACMDLCRKYQLHAYLLCALKIIELVYLTQGSTSTHKYLPCSGHMKAGKPP